MGKKSGIGLDLYLLPIHIQVLNGICPNCAPFPVTNERLRFSSKGETFVITGHRNSIVGRKDVELSLGYQV